VNVNLKGVELANHLAANLTDLEFELLVRERIKLLFNNAHNAIPNLSESINVCRFEMSWGDNSKWSVTIGENYSKSACIDGQVLSRCVHDVQQLYAMKHANKLSLLLPAPTPVVEEDTEDKKW
jgi:hypothetical protein